MAPQSELSIYWELFVRYSGLLVFFIIVALLNLFTHIIPEPPFLQVVIFLNTTISLLFAISLLFFIGAVLSILPFPLNLPGPVFSAAGAVVTVSFLTNAFYLFSNLTGIGIGGIVRSVSIIATAVVFLGMLTVGYVDIMRPLFTKNNSSGDDCPPGFSITLERKEDVSWQMVQAELRYAIYDILRRIRSEIAKELE
jgi:hypothetical protein